MPCNKTQHNSRKDGGQAVTMNYSRMRWLGAIVPGVVAWTFETLRHEFFERGTGGAVGNIVTFALVTSVTFVILHWVFDAMESVTRKLAEEQNRSALLKERERIAREMHDGLSQSLFFLNTKLTRVEKLLGQGDLNTAQGVIEEARRVTEEVYTRVRQTIYDLRAAAAEDWRLEKALARYVAEFEDDTGIEVDLAIEVEPECAAIEEAFHLFRIVQEALFNVRRHAEATKVRLVLFLDKSGRCELEIADNGRGFDVNAWSGTSGGHFGLVMMTERAKLIGAEFRVESAPGQGTRIRLFRPGAAEGGR
ncbi:MAG TPA: sensor histidine kinase [Limnochordia bacterium]|nr:sensor histidine kinase [Limnochordia bacterium]